MCGISNYYVLRLQSWYFPEDHIEVCTILFGEHLHDFNMHECKHGISVHLLVNMNSLKDRFNINDTAILVFEIKGLPS